MCKDVWVVGDAGGPLFPRPWTLRLEDSGRNGDFLSARYAVLGRR